MKNKYRDISCGKLDESFVDKEIKIAGWIETIRDHGGVLFLDLRDMTGEVQVVSNDDKAFSDLVKESTVSISGKVRLRSEDTINTKLYTGKIEVVANEVTLLGKAKNELPFEVELSKDCNEEIRFKHRYLDLRNNLVKDNIIFRSKVISYMRNMMESKEFLDMHTPILTASSPEGARDFIIPSRKHKGKFYALPQAPQIFKQLIMVSGFDKYFQIAPCFRDEDGRSDRTPGEFYQLDLEMSFATEEDVLEVGENIFRDLFTKFGTKTLSSEPFKRLTYKESMDSYGTDKPDLRNPLILQDISKYFENTTFKPFVGSVIKGIVVSNIGDNSNSWFNEIVDYASSIGMPGIGYLTLDNGVFKGPIDKFLSEEERSSLIENLKLKDKDVLFFIADRKASKAIDFASKVRLYLGKKADLTDESKYEFCIVKDFPMFEYSEELEKFDFTHNPFSMPQDISLKENTLAYQYDFVCNGYEMASGAVRNHDIKKLEETFKIAGYTKDELKSKFTSLYTAFKYGAPPHAGMALGIERTLMLLLDEDNIREVILFPMNNNAQDLMTGSPGEVSEMQLREVHIKVRD